MRTYPCIFHIVSRVKTTNALQSSTPHAAHDEKIIWRRMKSFSAEQKIVLRRLKPVYFNRPHPQINSKREMSRPYGAPLPCLLNLMLMNT